MENIIIRSLDGVRRKSGEKVEGMGNNGVHWQLFKINNKYSYFFNGDGDIDLKVGETYPFNVETKQEGQYTNYTITKIKGEAVPAEGAPAKPAGVMPIELILEGQAKILDKLDKIAKVLGKELGEEL